jgi:thioredoxin-dependent peroxiredoxin
MARSRVGQSRCDTDRLGYKNALCNEKSFMLQWRLPVSPTIDFKGPTMRNLILSLTALCAVVSFLLASTVNAEMPKVGAMVPDFEMQGSDGKNYSAKDFIGKQAVIIAWFPRAFTGGCTKECKSMKEHGELLKKYDVAYFTASTDPVDKNAEFAKSLDLDYPILCDPSGKNSKLFGVLKPDGKAANRVTFIISKEGKILAVEDAVKTETHGKDLADQLEKLGVAKKK